jgi:sortase B
LLIGLFKPCVVIAPASLQASRIGMVIRHELVHFKRRDLWAKLILLLVLDMYWFNPLVHIMAQNANRTIELCCDADALRAASHEQRRDYGLAILEALSQRAMRVSSLHSGFFGGKRQIKKRFQAIMEQSPHGMGWGWICFALILTVACASLVSFLPAGAIQASAISNGTTRLEMDFRNNVLEKKQLNPYTTGWLYVPGTSLNNPILHNPNENNSFFINVGFDGGFSETGSYFADYRSGFGASRDGLGRNTVIYGYSGDDDAKSPYFSQLKKYRDADFAREHPYIYFSTGEENIAWEVFAVFDTHVNLPYNLSDPQVMSVKELLAAVRESSIYDYDVAVGEQDRVLTLSCAAYDINGQSGLLNAYEYRFAVVAKMVPANAELKENAAFALNPDPLPPDAFKNAAWG